jgi:hypothetical protein
MIEAVEEGDFPHAPEEKKPLIKVAETWLRVDEAFFKLTKLFETIKTWMAHWSDHETPPPERELTDLITRAAREGARRATVEIQGNYTEGSNGSSPSWRNWVMGMLGTLIVLGIASLITMFANQKAMEARMNGVEQRITNIEHKIWP